MRLNEITSEVVEELKEKLGFLKNQTIKDAFKDSLFPHLNSSISGTVEVQSTPVWYTRIHDELEKTLVEYNEQDIKEGAFFELKMQLTPKSLVVFLYQVGATQPSVILKLEADVYDIRNGSFHFGDELIKGVQVIREEPLSVA